MGDPVARHTTEERGAIYCLFFCRRAASDVDAEVTMTIHWIDRFNIGLPRFFGSGGGKATMKRKEKEKKREKQ